MAPPRRLRLVSRWFSETGSPRTTEAGKRNFGRNGCLEVSALDEFCLEACPCSRQDPEPTVPLSVNTILGGTAWSAGGEALGLRGSYMQFGRTWALYDVRLGVFDFLMQTTRAHVLLM